MNPKDLFNQMYNANTEAELDNIIRDIENDSKVSWTPYGDNESYFGVIENQQAYPIPALIEKVTNSIDAILMRRCLEEGLDPKGGDAPKNIDQAIEQFFPLSKDWDLSGKRGLQAESIQILARGKRGDTSLVVYDDGEGQHPEKFGATFLSLLKGNKNEIPFVQGKYNMGGAGAVVFCGKKRYQLVASKRYEKSGEFGFTLLRKHPLTKSEEGTRKNTWYEYLLIDQKIPSFEIDSLDLGLYNRQFVTGTIIKLYSYNLPSGARSVISRDLNQSINEYLFEPALPLYTIDTKERYPQDRNLERHLYGLKRRLEEDSNKKYIKEFFSQTHNDADIGLLKITIYVFNPRIDGKSAKESKESIKREFFKNNMSVMFSLNGQVHGHFTSEYITRSLKFNILKDYLLIHVDCTNLKNNFRTELFMGSRDRLKQGDECSHLRQLLTKILTKGRLRELYKEWKNSLTTQSDSAEDLLKDFSKNLPMNADLMKLLSNALILDKKDKKKKKKDDKNPKKKESVNKPAPFNPKRFPSSFSIDTRSKDQNDMPLTQIPLGRDKTIPFSTDVEDQYFDRPDEPGDLKITVLSSSENDTDGGTKKGTPNDGDTIIDVSVSSPSKGKIRVNVSPNKNANVGDSVKVKAVLTSPNGDLEQVFLVKISDKEREKEKTTEKQDQADNIGWPKLQQVFEEEKDEYKCWKVLDGDGIAMDYNIVMHPLVEGDKLETIFVNMDSSVLKTYKSKLKSEEQLIAADKRYVSAVYFHTLFLYTINKKGKYQIKKPLNSDSNDLGDEDLADYLKYIFDTHYSEFLLKFEMSTLMESLAD